MWSLCYEEQFYALTGLILLVAPRHFFAASIVITAAAGVAVKVASARHWDVSGFFFDGYWFLFAMGILVYYYVNYAERLWQRAGLVSALIVTTAYFARNRATLFQSAPHFVQAATSGGLYALLLLSLHQYDVKLVSSKVLRPLVFCGEMCYSLYLIHWPVCKAISHGAAMLGVRNGMGVFLLVLPVCYTVSVAAAWQFHKMVERRFLNTPMSVRKLSKRFGNPQESAASGGSLEAL